MNKRRFIPAAALALACAISGGARAQQPATTLKLGWPTSDSATDPLAMGARAFKQALERQSGGTMQVQLYPNRQIGDDKQLVEGVRFGTVDAAVVTNAVTAQTEPAFGVLDLPFLFESAAHVQTVLDGAVGAELARRMAAKGAVVLGYFEGGFRSLINNTRPVAQPADMEGIKVRVMQNPIYIDLVNDLGGAAVPMAWGETITALQQGTIEGLELPIALIEPLKVSEFAKYLSLTNHTFTAYELLISKRRLDKLAAPQQAWVRAAAKEAVLAQRQGMAGQTPRALASLENTQMKVNPIVDVAAFRKAVAPIYDKARGAGQGDLIDAIQAAAPAAK